MAAVLVPGRTGGSHMTDNAASNSDRGAIDIGLFTPLRSPVAGPEFLSEFGPRVEAMGIHSIWLGEHVVTFDSYDSRYPGSPDGVFRFPEGSGLMDMVGSIGFLAACTSTLRLGTGICILPAAAMATPGGKLDHRPRVRHRDRALRRNCVARP